MSNAWNRRTMSIAFGIAALLSTRAVSQEKQEFHCTVGPKPVVSITNNYGPITVKPSGNNQVVATTVSHSGDVTFLNEQHGNRVELRAESKRPDTDLADYIVQVPSDAVVSLRSSGGRLHAEGLRGDVILEASTAAVEVSDITDAHVHIKTLSGPINLAGIRGSHLDVYSVSGNVSVHNVTESSVEVHAGSGRITYDGDPGVSGEYTLTTHTGDLDVSIPASAAVVINARSLQGESGETRSTAGNRPVAGEKNLFVKPGLTGATRFVLHSFKGKIRLTRP